MPLPPALLKRLAKRGLVDKSAKRAQNEAKVAQQAPAEEIIAEDYDEVDEAPPIEYDYDYQKHAKKSQQNFWSERLKKRIVDGSVNGYKGCANKFNIYHKCSLFCVNTFGDGIKEPSKNYTKRKVRLLRRYPLPKDWKEIYDEGVGVHYYWNSVDDMVSWLPPSHPRAVRTKSAAVLRREMEASLPEIDENEENNVQLAMESVEPAGYTSDSNQSNSVREQKQQQQPKPPVVKKPKARDLDKVLRSKSERRMKRNAMEGSLDPMDPASYSEVPRGKWSAGLECENTKTGADSTVSGALYQMRPYPNPGAVLRANAEKDTDGVDNNDSDQNQDG